jgi:hypothetical protein
MSVEIVKRLPEIDRVNTTHDIEVTGEFGQCVPHFTGRSTISLLP